MQQIILDNIEKEIIRKLNHPIATVEFLEEWLNRSEPNYDGKNPYGAEMVAMSKGYYAAVKQIVCVLLEQAAKEVDQAILDSLPDPADCHHDFSPEFERKMMEIMKLRKGD